jgi:hypothetical protein
MRKKQKALRDGASFEQVAKRFHLNGGTVRRLAGKAAPTGQIQPTFGLACFTILLQSGQCDKLLAFYRARGTMPGKSVAKALEKDTIHRFQIHSGLSRPEGLDAIQAQSSELLDKMECTATKWLSFSDKGQ